MAVQRQIIISEVDHAQLANLFSGESPTRGTDKSSLQTLRGELDIATVVDPEDVPFNVVTLNSTVRLSDSRSSYEDTYTLVYPDDAGDTDSHLSVLDPVGIAILGYRVGDLVEWPFPRGTATFRIKELVFQPERDGIIAWVSQILDTTQIYRSCYMSNNKKIIISKEDHSRLENLFFSGFATALSSKPYLQALRHELSIAQVLPPGEIPPDVVTMNSIIRLRQLRSNDIETYTLVYPESADIAEGKLSVLAPIGTAILGNRVGDRVECQVPSGLIRFKIEGIVFQPERDGVAA